MTEWSGLRLGPRVEMCIRDRFYSVHGGFSTNNVNEDPEVLVPLTALKEAEREGKIGKLDDYYLSLIHI